MGKSVIPAAEAPQCYILELGHMHISPFFKVKNFNSLRYFQQSLSTTNLLNCDLYCYIGEDLHIPMIPIS